MASLVQKLWLPQRHKTIVCIDSYHSGILQGRLYGPGLQEQRFHGLREFLGLMDTLPERPSSPGSIPKGCLATFELQVLFREHASWQGVILWKEQQSRQNFRSVLELVSLMDSALRLPEGREAV